MTWREPYMWVRWATVGIGQVITVDDDVLPPEVTINQLILFKQKQPDSLHSTHGRNAKPGCIYNYQQTNDGPAQVGTYSLSPSAIGARYG
eukprot:9186932-Pyramimonas_sp.AAC.1